LKRVGLEGGGWGSGPGDPPSSTVSKWGGKPSNAPGEEGKTFRGFKNPKGDPKFPQDPLQPPTQKKRSGRTRASVEIVRRAFLRDSGRGKFETTP